MVIGNKYVKYIYMFYNYGSTVSFPNPPEMWQKSEARYAIISHALTIIKYCMQLHTTTGIPRQ